MYATIIPYRIHFVPKRFNHYICHAVETFQIKRSLNLFFLMELHHYFLFFSRLLHYLPIQSVEQIPFIWMLALTSAIEAHIKPILQQIFLSSFLSILYLLLVNGRFFIWKFIWLSFQSLLQVPQVVTGMISKMNGLFRFQTKSSSFLS